MSTSSSTNIDHCLQVCDRIAIRVQALPLHSAMQIDGVRTHAPLWRLDGGSLIPVIVQGHR